MGINRMLWRYGSKGIGWIIDAAKNISEESSLTGGIRRTLKEDFCEDNPITSYIYSLGKNDGKKDGYIKASSEYEIKLLEQADKFLKQDKIFESEKDAYE